MLNCEGALVTDANGQPVFRLAAVKCQTCPVPCQRVPVREIVIPSPVSMQREGQRATLVWPRRELTKAVFVVYGPPLAGMLLGLLASRFGTVADGMAAAVTGAGMVAGMVVSCWLGRVWVPGALPELTSSPINNE